MKLKIIKIMLILGISFNLKAVEIPECVHSEINGKDIVTEEDFDSENLWQVSAVVYNAIKNECFNQTSFFLEKDSEKKFFEVSSYSPLGYVKKNIYSDDPEGDVVELGYSMSGKITDTGIYFNYKSIGLDNVDVLYFNNKNNSAYSLSTFEISNIVKFNKDGRGNFRRYKSGINTLYLNIR